MKNHEFDLESVLSEIGEFGRFQVMIYICLSLPVFLASSYFSSFIFTTGIGIDYRCRIPQCDQEYPEFSSNWLEFTTPFTKNGVPDQCLQYKFDESDNFMNNVEHQCNKRYFNQSNAVRCHEFVYSTDSITILNDFNLTCEENAWKLTTIGSIKNIGGIIVLPINGVISDRYGRKTLLIASICLSGIFGMLTSFSINYWMYAVLEFITSMCAASIYMVVFILGMELVGASKRVLGCTIISLMYVIGQMVLGFLAMKITNYRNLLQAIYLPSFLVLSYIWLLPESLHWLISKGQDKKALKIIHEAAKINQVAILNSTLESLNIFSDHSAVNNRNCKNNRFVLVFRSKILVTRFLIVCFCWFSNGFIYYGITIHAVSLAGNIYVNFILISLAEVPAIIIAYFLMQYFRRKWSMALPLFVSAVVCITAELVHDYSPWWQIILFGIGKCSITIASTVSFVYTTELFPTNFRQSFMSYCDLVARIGAMIAPQISLLAYYVPTLPAFLFGVTSFVASLLVLLLPETFNMKLPDTTEEAERIGKEL